MVGLVKHNKDLGYMRWIVSRLLKIGALCTMAITTGMLAAVFAQSIDPHKLYEQRCGNCHAPHAGAFVRENLVMSNGNLIGRETGREVRAFLDAGHGRLTPAETETIMVHFISIQQSGGLFQEKCRICHDRAVKLSRNELIIEDTRLIGRYSKRDIALFLANHGRLKEDEVPRMVNVLKRHLNTREEK